MSHLPGGRNANTAGFNAYPGILKLSLAHRRDCQLVVSAAVMSVEDSMVHTTINAVVTS